MILMNASKDNEQNVVRYDSYQNETANHVSLVPIEKRVRDIPSTIFKKTIYHYDANENPLGCIEKKVYDAAGGLYFRVKYINEMSPVMLAHSAKTVFNSKGKIHSYAQFRHEESHNSVIRPKHSTKVNVLNEPISETTYQNIENNRYLAVRRKSVFDADGKLLTYTEYTNSIFRDQYAIPQKKMIYNANDKLVGVIEYQNKQTKHVSIAPISKMHMSNKAIQTLNLFHPMVQEDFLKNGMNVKEKEGVLCFINFYKKEFSKRILEKLLLSRLDVHIMRSGLSTLKTQYTSDFREAFSKNNVSFRDLMLMFEVADRAESQYFGKITRGKGGPSYSHARVHSLSFDAIHALKSLAHEFYGYQIPCPSELQKDFYKSFQRIQKEQAVILTLTHRIKKLGKGADMQDTKHKLNADKEAVESNLKILERKISLLQNVNRDPIFQSWCKKMKEPALRMHPKSMDTASSSKELSL